MDGFFYVPNATMITTNFIKIEMLFNNSGLVGDQTGGEGTSPYGNMTEYPDNKTDGKDLAFLNKKFSTYEGETSPTRWDYMADINHDGKCDGKDIAIAAKNFGKYGSYIYNLSGVNVTFSTGDMEWPDANGYVAIPTGATNLTITLDGATIGAMVTFWQVGS
jgi:hypothetical protein